MTAPLALTDVLIRSPQQAVFDAFVKPELLTQFWLKSASGPLGVGERVRWDFMADGSSESVIATELSPPHLISFSWSDGVDVRIRVEPFEQAASRVFVEASEFETENAVQQAVAATAGFTIVLCDLKTLLEQGVSAGLVRDKALLITADAAES